MAGRSSSAFHYYALVFYLILSIGSNNGVRFGDKSKTLHVAEDRDSIYYRKPVIIEQGDDSYDASETSSSRTRRDVPAAHPNSQPNITTKVRRTIFPGNSAVPRSPLRRFEKPCEPVPPARNLRLVFVLLSTVDLLFADRGDLEFYTRQIIRPA